jgi:hypothetical protein
MRARIWLGLLSMLLSCDDRRLVVVSVAPLPMAASEIYASLTYRSLPARKPAPIRFSLAGQDLTAPATFGVHLDPQTDGDLVVGAGVLDSGGCLTAFGSGTVDKVSVSSRLDVTLSLTPDESLTADERCTLPETTPLLLSISPPRASSAGGERVVLRGWGFGTDTCSRVSVNAVPATEVLCRSLVEISATVPASSVVGRVPLQVLNLNNRRAVSTMLFSYYAENVRLGAAVSFPVAASPIALTAGLVDADARADLVVASRDSNSVSVFINDGLGTFPMGFQTSAPVGVHPSAVAIGDIDKNGLADVLVTSANDQAVTVLRQAKPMVPVSFSPAAHVFVNLLPSAVALGDVDGNGALDAVVANQLSSDVTVLLNSGSGSLARSPGHDQAVAREPVEIALADLNQDGKLDLVVRSRMVAGLGVISSVYENGRDTAGGSSSAALRSYELTAAPTAMAVEDLDGEQGPDAVVALADGTIHILWNDGHGNLIEDAHSQLTGAVDVTALGVGDLDLDGHPDVVAVAAAEQRLLILRNTRLRSGQRGFARLAGGYPTFAGGRPVAITIADLDGDGLPDVAVADQRANMVSVLLNKSS